MERADAVKKKFNAFILDESYPCLMAKAVFNTENFVLRCYHAFGCAETAKELQDDIEIFIDNYNFDNNRIQSFIAVFPDKKIDTELKFEQLLWQQLRALDNISNHEWDDAVSENPEDGNFSFSIAGKAFYVVGMHPKSSRIARRSPYPALVFNLHHQFENLRKRKVFEDVKLKIRKRDAALQGFENPMVSDFGTESEARQYSGRKVDASWKCPFHHKK